MVAERKDHVFKDLAADDQEQQPMEIESYCINCGENGTTRLLLTKIPHYKEVILMSFSCEHCGMHNNEIQSGGKIQEQGVKYRVLIQNERDLGRQVVKSDFASIYVPEIELEIPQNSHRGEITTVEGVLRRTISGLEQDQPVRRAREPEDAAQIDTFIKRIEDLLNLNQPFHIELSDPSGNSYLENLFAPRSDPAREVTYFVRTPEQNRMLGIYSEADLREAEEGGAVGGAGPLPSVEEEEEKADGACAALAPLASPSITSTASSTSPLLAQQGSEGGKTVRSGKEATVVFKRRSSKDESDDFEDLESYSEHPPSSSGPAEVVEDLRDEVLTFHTNCPECNAPASTNMKVTSIPHFKEVVIMATVCDYCGHKTNEVKSGGGIESQGKKITLRLTEISDLSRDVLKSETCRLLLPDLDLEMGSHVMGGKFTTLEGLLRNVLDQIEQNPLYGGALAVGDSATPDSKLRLTTFKNQLSKMIEGEAFPYILILDDPAGNSYLQNVYAPEEDPEMTIEHYDRTFDQNEELGLNDMITEGYETNAGDVNPTTKERDETKASCSDAQHLMEIGRAGRHLLTRDDIPHSTVTSPLNHHATIHGDNRRTSAARSTKSVSSPCGGGIHGGGRPCSQTGTHRTGSASPDGQNGTRQ